MNNLSSHTILFALLFLLVASFNFNHGLASEQDEFVIIPDTSIQRIDAETEIPVEIQVSRFMIGKTEVTQAQFEEVLNDNPSFYKGANKPVESVNWWDAIRYCNERSIQEGFEPCYDLSTGECDFSKNGYRLPTHIEWSIASCYTDTSFDYEEFTKKGNFGVNNTEDIQLLTDELQNGTSPVAQYEKNKLGLYDKLIQ